MPVTPVGRGGLLTLSMILKDEAATVGRTLASVKPFVDRFVIADTGSTDGTRAAVAAAMAGVEGELIDLPFVDFATTRNAALDRCGTATEFILWLDADDELVGGASLRAFLEAERRRVEPDREAYYVRVDTGIRFDSPRVVRSRAGWRFKGVVHEVLVHEDRATPTHRPPDALIVHRPSGASAERSRRRWERDLGLLRGELASRPGDTRTAFYLAQTYQWLGRHGEAMQAFRERIALGGWAEEIYQSGVGLAEAAEVEGRPWAEVLELYLAAHASAPHRAEPLHAVALHYNALGEHALCLLFARRGFELPLPKSDRLFVDEDVYRWKLADLVASSAYWLGAFELGEAAARQALRHQPDDPRLQQNLRYYLDRKRQEKNRRR